MLLDIFWTLLLVFLNGFFVASEFAIVKVRSSQIELKAKTGSRSGNIAKRITTHLDGYLAATQLGITLASLALGFIGESIVSKIIINIFNFFGSTMSEASSHSIALPISFLIITVLHIVFGELAPKSLAIQRPISTTFAIALPLQFFYILFRPFIWVLNGFANAVLKLVGIIPVHGHEVHSSEELQLLIEQGKDSGALDSSEHTLIKNVFDFKDRVVKNIMIPRTKIAAINIKTPYPEYVDMVIAEGYTRIPVFEDTVDNITGIIHVKDVLVKLKNNENMSISETMRPAYFVPESKKISDLLTELKNQKNPMMAIVLDEFGGTAGLVTMEDIIEELVGEIQDEYDEEIPVVEKINENEFVVNASASISDVNEYLPTNLPEEDDYDSIAGLMNFIFEKIPEVSEEIEYAGYQFIILKKTKRNVELVKMILIQPEISQPLIVN